MQILKIVLLAIIIIFIVLIFPIFLNLNFHYSMDAKKLFYQIKLFGFIKILGGYAQLIEEGVVIHLTKNKAIILPFSKIFDVRKKVEPLKDYHFIKLKTVTEIGVSDSAILPTVLSFSLSFIDKIVCWFLYNFKSQLDVDNRFFVFEGVDRLEIFCKLDVVFNILMIIISAIKILTEKVIYANGN